MPSLAREKKNKLYEVFAKNFSLDECQKLFRVFSGFLVIPSDNGIFLKNCIEYDCRKFIINDKIVSVVFSIILAAINCCYKTFKYTIGIFKRLFFIIKVFLCFEYILNNESCFKDNHYLRYSNLIYYSRNMAIDEY